MAADEPTVVVEHAGAVATITLNRPAQANALTYAMRAELQRALRDASRDASVRCIVLAGAGRTFCAGQDLREEGGLEDVAGAIRDGYAPIIRAIADAPKPVVAAVQGAAAGAGAALALACDLRVFSDDAYVLMAFSNIGLVPDSGASWFLVHQVGYQRAFEMCATGRRVPAHEALTHGLCERVVLGDALAGDVAALAAELAARPPLALGFTKRLLRRSLTAELDDVLELEAQLQRTAAGQRGSPRGRRRVPREARPDVRGTLTPPHLRLIVNPVASRANARTLEQALTALAPCEVEVVTTAHAGQAGDLARESIDLGHDAVVVLAGDGTANDVLNRVGIEIPVGLLPAGGTSVLPRALGLPNQVRQAAEKIREAALSRRTRTIALGAINGRRFAFAAGIGFDADVVRRVDAAGRARGKRPGDTWFAMQAVRTLAERALPDDRS